MRRQPELKVTVKRGCRREVMRGALSALGDAALIQDNIYNGDRVNTIVTNLTMSTAATPPSSRSLRRRRLLQRYIG